MHKHVLKYILVVILMLGVTTSFFGQSKIKTRLLHSDTTSYQFTGEWQYLSTDVYLFNGSTFSNLINELNFAKEQKGGLFNFKKETNEFLEYLYITASLKNVRFFDQQEITYPLYNFRINREKENKYRTYISDDIDHIRIIDNLPLYSAQDFIDAEINVHAITNNSGDQVIKLIARQLQNISKITNPSTAVLSLVGELGNFMESSSRRKEYKFRSTIRLYEKKDFNSRIHSVRVYAMVTENSEGYQISNDKLQAYLQDVSNRSIDRKTLNALLDLKQYPYLVVVNYKSLYKMDAVSGDEITFASIEERKLQIENDYNSGLINEDTYRLEKDFLDFLTIFANLKKTIEMYNLNFKTGNSEAISNSVFNVVQYYRQLLETYRQYRFKYRNNNTFHRIFKPEYKSILGYADIYLEKDHYLTNCRNLAETTMQLDSMRIQELDSAQTEQLLNDLHFSDIFNQQHLKETPEGETILQQIKTLEQYHYNNEFESHVAELKQLEGEEKQPRWLAEVRKSARATNCKQCKDSILQAFADYKSRKKEFEKKRLLQTIDTLLSNAQHELFQVLERLDRLQKNVDLYYQKDSLAPPARMVRAKLKNAREDADKLHALLATSLEELRQKEVGYLQDFTGKVQDYQRSIRRRLSFVCSYKVILCKDTQVIRQQQKAEKLRMLKKEYNRRSREVTGSLNRLEDTMDSMFGEPGKSDSLPGRNQRVLQEIKRELHHEISRINQLVYAEPGSSEEYRMRLNQLDEQLREIEQKLRLWCSQHVEFCPLLDVFTENF